MTVGSDEYLRPMAETPRRRAGRRAASRPRGLEVLGPGALTAVVLGAFGAAVRLVWVFSMSRTPLGISDLTVYPAAARGIANGDGYTSLFGTPTSYYPPGYPLFLGGLQWLLDRVGLDHDLVFTAGVAQALLGGVTVGAAVLVGTRLGGRRLGPAVGVASGLLVALWPNLVMHSSLMLSESLYLAFAAVLLAAVVHAGAEAGEREHRGALVVAALAMGLCTFTRPQSALLLLPAFGIAWLVSGAGWRRTLLRVGALVAGILVVVGPWTIRNAVVLDGFVPVSSNTGDNLCIGFNPDATGGFMAADFCETGEFYFDGPDAEVRRNSENQSKALEWALGHLGELPSLSWDKLRITFENDRDALAALESFGADDFLGSGARRTFELTMDSWYVAMVALGAVGVVLVAVRTWGRRREDPTGMVVLFVALAGVLVPVSAFGDPRFKVPLEPTVALLAAFTLVQLGSWIRAARTERNDRTHRTERTELADVAA